MSLAGPTNFAPLIYQAISLCAQAGSYHILLIIADGELTPDNEYQTSTSDTRNAVVMATEYPLSIVVVGVGDGPFDGMHVLDDDDMPGRAFDNLQFVEFEAVKAQSSDATTFANNFAKAALMEVPEQYARIKELKLLDRRM